MQVRQTRERSHSSHSPRCPTHTFLPSLILGRNLRSPIPRLHRCPTPGTHLVHPSPFHRLLRAHLRWCNTTIHLPQPHLLIIPPLLDLVFPLRTESGVVLFLAAAEMGEEEDGEDYEEGKTETEAETEG